jgi:hypothetical protein
VSEHFDALVTARKRQGDGRLATRLRSRIHSEWIRRLWDIHIAGEFGRARYPRVFGLMWIMQPPAQTLLL